MKGTYEKLNKIRNGIEQYQNNEYIHPLTCGNNSLHENLFPQLEKKGEEFELYLVCKECDWKQDIPNFLREWR